MPVIGQPSLKLREVAGGGVESTLERKSQWAEYISSEDVKALEAIMQRIVDLAKSLSRGRLSYRNLSDLGHPYGKGKQRGLGIRARSAGVSNLAVVNLHSGDFLDAWGGRLEWGKGSVRFVLYNSHFTAAWLMKGTKKMKAHGAFSAAIVKFLPEINRLFAAATRRGYERAKLEASLAT